MAEAHVVSNLVVVLLLAAGVAVGFFVRRNRLWREAAADLRRAQLQDPFAPQVRHALKRFQAGTLGGAKPGK